MSEGETASSLGAASPDSHDVLNRNLLSLPSLHTFQPRTLASERARAARARARDRAPRAQRPRRAIWWRKPKLILRYVVMADFEIHEIMGQYL